jgi:hypothetical protein
MRALSALATAGAVAAAGCGALPGPDAAPDRPSPARSTADGGPYWLGPSYRGLPLTSTPPNSYICGDCDPPPDAGCPPPYEVQHAPICERNPLSLDIEARRVFPVRGGAIAAEYDEASIDVGIGRHTVTVFAYTSDRARRAVYQLRRRSQTEPPKRLPPPVYPKAMLQELKRVAVAHRRLRSIRELADRIGLSRRAAASRLRIATLLGPDALADVEVPERPWRIVRHERKVARFAQAIGRRATARRFGLTLPELRRIIHRVRGLTGLC